MLASVFRSAAAAAQRSATVARRQLTTSSTLRADAVSEAKSAVSEVKSAAASAKDAASSTVNAASSSAQQAASSAQSQLSSAAEKAKQLGGPYAARAQSIFSSVSESVIYNLRVVGALAKQVYVAERLAPPTSTQTILDAYKSIWAFASNPASWSRVVQNGEWKKVGIYSVEALGIFTIGEMIGRRSIVGYSLNTKHHGHGHH